MKVVVTGGAGFIGSHLVDRLLSEGAEVTVLDNLSNGRLENLSGVIDDVRFFQDDIRDFDAVKIAVEGADTVFHEAALGSVPRSVADPATSNEVNVTGTLNVLVAARDAGVRRVVFASSSSVYGDTPTLPKHEQMPTVPTSPYGVTKLAGEMYFRSFAGVYGLETICLRYFNVFGPRQDPNGAYAAVIPIFTKKLLAGETPTVFGEGEQSRDFTFVSNVVDANMLAMESTSGIGEVFNIAAGNPVTLNALVEQMQLITNTDIKLAYAEPRAGDIRHSFGDMTRAKAVLGFEPRVQLEDGLRETIPSFGEVRKYATV